MAYFQTKLGKFLRVLQWKMLVHIFNAHLVHFTDIWCVLCPFGIFSGRLAYFSLFWYFVPRKFWQPCQVESCGDVNTEQRLSNNK
jgi:hypothetical protein